MRKSVIEFRVAEIGDHSNQVCPRSFDDWRKKVYATNLDTLTQVVLFNHTWEQARGGFLCGSATETVRVRIPFHILTETGAIIDAERLCHFGKLLARKKNDRLPIVTYQGKRLYAWSQD